MEFGELVRLLLENLKLSNDTLDAFVKIEATHGEALVNLKKLVHVNKQLINLVERELEDAE